MTVQETLDTLAIVEQKLGINLDVESDENLQGLLVAADAWIAALDHPEWEDCWKAVHRLKELSFQIKSILYRRQGFGIDGMTPVES